MEAGRDSNPERLVGFVPWFVPRNLNESMADGMQHNEKDTVPRPPTPRHYNAPLLNWNGLSCYDGYKRLANWDSVTLPFSSGNCSFEKWIAQNGTRMPLSSGCRFLQVFVFSWTALTNKYTRYPGLCNPGLVLS